MKQIKYEKEKNLIITQCKIFENISVGSVVCQKCKFFKGINGFSQFVLCNFKKD